MGFVNITKEDIVEKLKIVGVNKGDTIYVASYMPILGPGPNILSDTLEALLEAVGEDGTVVMPTFNYDYCSGNLFDPVETPSKMGVLTEEFRKDSRVLRSISPPWCPFAAAGKKAGNITEIRGTTSFGSDSILQYLYDINVRYVLLGCTYNEGAIHIHWLEEKLEVPYRFWKKFEGNVKLSGKITRDVSFMYAKEDLEVLEDIDTSHITSEFDKSGKVKIEKIGLGQVRSFVARDYVDFVEPHLRKDKLAGLLPEARKYFE